MQVQRQLLLSNFTQFKKSNFKNHIILLYIKQLNPQTIVFQTVIIHFHR